MLESGVKIITKEEVEEANRFEHMWTDQAKNFVLIRWSKGRDQFGDKDPRSFRLYSFKFKEFCEFPIFVDKTDNITWDDIMSNMIEAGVPIIEREEGEKFIKAHEQEKK